MSEKLTAKQAAEQLLYKPEYAADKSADVKEKAAAFAEGYKAFLNAAKTEREAAAASEKLLLEAGYEKFEPKKTYAPGQKIYFVQEHKAVVAATIGRKSFEEGFRLVIAHIDSPRLDLRPNPLYEADHLSYFKTHYYGGIRKYQWGTMPLAIHGVFARADGSSVSFAVGEDENDPVFCITDLLPHLGAEQNDRKLSEGIKAEELNVLIGSDAVEDADIKEAVKLNTLMLLHEKYGITERDFTRAEIEVVPAHKARDVGFDRSMVGGYGHDDRVDAYPALMAEIETKDPVHTTVCVLTDKEEIGSDGVTGMQSMYVFHFMQLLCRAAGQDDILAFQNSVCLSADVTAAYDPSWANAFEPQNGTYAGRGVAFFKYTGSRGKSSASDASAELVGDITCLLDANGVAWQIGELGRLDLGGGGTIAKYVANRGIPVLDIGVPVLSMHSPFEVIHKTDLYMATTTHILRPENGLWAKTDAEIQELWARGSYAVVGSPAPKGKLTAPPEADLAHWMAQADAVFLEADGAKHFPCKAPAEQEPVLLPQSDIVLAVAGLSALGHPLKECCFRLEQACMLLGVPPEACLTPELLAQLLASEQGGRKRVGSRAFYAVLNQADTPQRQLLGKQTLCVLQERYRVNGVLTQFEEGERA